MWQDHLHTAGDDIRLNWRNTHWDIKNIRPVKLPIRYGRRSSSNIMTMVVSNRMARKMGFRYVVPLKIVINNVEELLDEAMALSTAEGMEGDFVRPWGVLTYLLNDSLIDVNQKREIVRLFRQRKNAEFDVLDYKVGRERSCITHSLKLNIKWVTSVLKSDQSKIDKRHYLLATGTKPMNRIPTTKEIAATITSDHDRKHFIHNFMNGIITYDDFEISKFL